MSLEMSTETILPLLFLQLRYSSVRFRKIHEMVKRHMLMMAHARQKEKKNAMTKSVHVRLYPYTWWRCWSVIELFVISRFGWVYNWGNELFNFFYFFNTEQSAKSLHPPNAESTYSLDANGPSALLDLFRFRLPHASVLNSRVNFNSVRILERIVLFQIEMIVNFQ